MVFKAIMGLKKIVAIEKSREIGKIAPNIISCQSPRLLMWFTNGNAFKCNGKLPIPSGPGELNYVKSLQNRCQKAEKTNTPIIFAYSSALLNKQQINAIEDLVNRPEFKTLFCVDFEAFIKNCLESPRVIDSDKFIIWNANNKIEAAIKGFQKGVSISAMDHNSIAYIVDSARMVLLNYCEQIEIQIQSKYAHYESKKTILKGYDKGAVYLDFDVTNLGEKIQTIELPSELDGIMFSTNFINKKLLGDDVFNRLDMKKYPKNAVIHDEALKFEQKYLSLGEPYKRLQYIIKVISCYEEAYKENWPDVLTSALKVAKERKIDDIKSITSLGDKSDPVFYEFLIDFVAVFQTEHDLVKIMSQVLGLERKVSFRGNKSVYSIENSLIGVSTHRHPIINITVKKFVQMPMGKSRCDKSDCIYDIFHTVSSRFFAYQFSLRNFIYKGLNKMFIEEGFDYECYYNFGNVNRTPFNAVDTMIQSHYFGHNVDCHQTWSLSDRVEYNIELDDKPL